MKSSVVLPKSEATVAKILAAAETLFLKKNYAEVTMDQIASASHVTKGALYHHFSSKEELYLAMMHRDLDAKRELFGRVLESGRDCRQRLRLLTRAFFDLPRQKRNVIKLVRRDINVFGEPMRGQLVRAYQAALPEQVERIIREGIRTGELASADARLLSWQFVAMVELILGDYADRIFAGTDAKLDHVLGLFFAGAGGTKTDRMGSR